MVARSYIKKNLDYCAKKHAKAGKKESLFLAKMAVLELCGWIELSFDEVVLKCARTHLRDPASIKYVEKTVIGKTYGFEYERHFSEMLIRLIGLIRFEALESQVDPAKLAKFKAALTTLKTERDREAHTYVKGTTRTMTAPSVILSLFNDVDSALVEFEREVKALKF